MGDQDAKNGRDNTGRYRGTIWTGIEKRKWGEIRRPICVQQIGYRWHNIPTQAHIKSYMGLTEQHYTELGPSYWHQ